MKQELVRMTSIDNLEMVGILYEQKRKVKDCNSCTRIMWQIFTKIDI